jgi:hypothetical protein
VHERRPPPVGLRERLLVAARETAAEVRDLGVVDGGVGGGQDGSSPLGAADGAAPL